jgi:hypothetical protein
LRTRDIQFIDAQLIEAAMGVNSNRFHDAPWNTIN